VKKNQLKFKKTDWFNSFYKPETEKTELKPRKNRAKTKPNQKNQVKPV
jgi:hypothetical protein